MKHRGPEPQMLRAGKRVYPLRRGTAVGVDVRIAVAVGLFSFYYINIY